MTLSAAFTLAVHEIPNPRPKKGRRPMTDGFPDTRTQTMDQMCAEIREDAQRSALDALRDEVRTLHAELAALRKKPAPKWWVEEEGAGIESQHRFEVRIKKRRCMIIWAHDFPSVKEARAEAELFCDRMNARVPAPPTAEEVCEAVLASERELPSYRRFRTQTSTLDKPKEGNQMTTEQHPLRLVVVDNRGLTFVGRCTLDGDEDMITIHDAQCVIRWNTERHLAELAGRGLACEPTLGEKRDVQVTRRNIVLIYECDEEAWR